MKYKLLLFLLTLCFLQFGYTQPGTLDLAFGKKGIATADLGTKSSFATLATQVISLSNGNMYIFAGIGEFTYIIKKKQNGITDSSFGIYGHSQTVKLKNPVAALQTDGKIVVVGTSTVDSDEDHFPQGNDFTAARFNTDGSLDKSFAGKGFLTTDFNQADDYATSVAIQADDKILIGGTVTVYYYPDPEAYGIYNIGVVRYNIDGTLDNTFDGDGMYVADAATEVPEINPVFLNLQTGGKILATTSTYLQGLHIIRLNANGSKDNSFVNNETLLSYDSTFYCNSTVLQSDGKLIIGGSWLGTTHQDFTMYRFNLNGSLDITFGNSGKVSTDFRGYSDNLTSLTIQADNKIVAFGSASNGSNYAFAVSRYNTNGTIDNSFDVDGKKMTYVGSYNLTGKSVTIQSDGKILAAGYNNPPSLNSMTLIRYNIDGMLDNTFDGNGTLAENFKKGNTAYNAVAVQNDGKVVAAGYTMSGSISDFLISRYNVDGTLDKSFALKGYQTVSFSTGDEKAYDVAIQPDGKIIVSGQSVISGNGNMAITRLNADGSLDISFDGDGKKIVDAGASEIASHLAIQSDGKIIFGGNSLLIRCTANGALDATFNGTGKLGTAIPVADMALQSTGKIIVASSRDSTYLLARYNTNGSLDNTFSGDGLQSRVYSRPELDPQGYESYSVTVNSLAIQKDDKIIVAGEIGRYGRYDYVSRIGLMRFTSNGAIDPGFSADGKQDIAFPQGFSNKPLVKSSDDNKIIVESSIYFVFVYNPTAPTTNIFLGSSFTRLNTDGSTDNSFGTAGYSNLVLEPLHDIAISNSNLFAAGQTIDPAPNGIVYKYKASSGNTPPVVTIISPANNAVFLSPATFNIKATASDADGSIRSVKFYKDDIYILTDFSAPYTYGFSNLSSGTYHFKVKATDNLGAETFSSTITVIVNTAPVVNITSPANNAVYSASANVTINATASDGDGTIQSVKFYKDDVYLNTDFTAPYTYTLTNLLAGTYVLKVKATDNVGTETFSTARTITVKNSVALANVVTNTASVGQGYSVSLSPNPAKDILQVSISGVLKNTAVLLSIFSSDGVVKKQINMNGKSQSLNINISDLLGGTYTLQIKSGDKISNKQFIKL